jgi:hypothetical protein
MKLVFKSFLIFCFLLTFSSQNQKNFTVAKTYEEPQDPAPAKHENWAAVPKGLQASVVSNAIRFVRSEIPKVEQQNSWTGAAWKGERRLAQVVLWSNDSLTEVMTEFSDFKSDSGNRLPASIAEINFVKYVITDVFGDGCGNRKPEDFPSSLVADALDPVASYAIKTQETRPIWVTINVPINAKVGTYKSTFFIHIKGQETKQFEFSFGYVAKPLCTSAFS